MPITPFVPPPRSEAQRFALDQMRALLEENNVPKPHILWIRGDRLLDLFERIGKLPFPMDGPIIHAQLYRYNVCTGRFKKAEPYDPNRKALPHVYPRKNY